MIVLGSYGSMLFNGKIKYLKSSRNFMLWLRGNQARSLNAFVVIMVVSTVDLLMFIASSMVLEREDSS